MPGQRKEQIGVTPATYNELRIIQAILEEREQEFVSFARVIADMVRVWHNANKTRS